MQVVTRKEGIALKIIHCADLHLDSNMETHFGKEKARQRRAELLNTFNKMLSYAKENRVDAIIIAGDLFDKKNVSATAKNIVNKGITNNPEIDFYYLKGNHDRNCCFDELEILPDNLKFFGDKWKSYDRNLSYDKKVVISGVELNNSNCNTVYEELKLKQEDFNIVVLHGQDGHGSLDGETISLANLKGKNIDYLALGHIHSYMQETLDYRGIYCYSGCLEGRGFDECGEHGFVVLDINEITGTVSTEFVSVGSRNVYCLPVELSDVKTTQEAIDVVKKVLKEIPTSSIVKLELEGHVDAECEISEEGLWVAVKDEFFCVKIKNKLRFKVNYQEFLYEESLKGEFVRMVMADENLTKEERATIVRYGIMALAGEDIE